MLNMNNNRNVANNSVNNTSNQANESAWSELDGDESVMHLLDDPLNLIDNSRLRTDKNYYGFDNNSGDSWIYPTNLPIRSYQYNITKSALFRNTLVVLPTGLGKTFIAAVIIYNIYRWYPTGKIIFMAPTRPLVTQQIEACRKIVGIPKIDTSEMTGKQTKSVRRELWDRKRVFFATPQVVQTDIFDTDQDFPFDQVKLLVIDEAHRAKGRYAYTEVVNTMMERNPNFRIVALSATPGRRIEDVAEIVRNLRISHVEIRWENSIDVAPYTYKKNLKTLVVKLGERLTKVREEFIQLVDPYVRLLIDHGVLSGNSCNMTRWFLIMEQKRFRETSLHERHPNHSVVSTNFSACISLYHALDLLERHGVRVFLNFFEEINESSKGEKFFVATNSKLRMFLEKLRKEVGPNPFAVSDQTMTNGKIPAIPDNLDFGHPKFDIVKKHLLDYFQSNTESKAIVFCEYRESVLLLHRLLLQNRPLIKPRIFVGQGGNGSIRAVTQKQQMQIMTDFRDGISNTLIATSVAEEGLDVGDVDMIICFDMSTKNPTRFIQRIGRTGRKRQGQVLMLVTEGKEEAMVKEVLATRDKTNQKISKSREILSNLYTRSPRIVPPEFNPKCVETFMKIYDGDDMTTSLVDEGKATTKPNKENKKSSKVTTSKKTIKNTKPKNPANDVRNFFKKIELDKEEREIFCSPKETAVTKSIGSQGPLAFLENNHENFASQHNIENNMVTEAIIHRQYDDELNSQLTNLFNNVNNFWEKNNDTEKADDLLNITETLNSKNIPSYIKKCILNKNYDFVKEKFDAIQAFNVVAGDDDVQFIDESVENLKQEFDIIEKILGGRSGIEAFLKKKPTYVKPNSDLDKKFSNIFAGLKKREFDDSIYNFLEENLANINLEETDMSLKEETYCGESTADDFIDSKDDNTLLDYTDTFYYPTFTENESKYINQFEKKEIANQSTPLKSKTPGKLNQKFSSFAESPIMKAFAKSVEKKCALQRQGSKFSGIANNNCNEESVVKEQVISKIDEQDTSLLFDDDFDDFVVNNSHLLADIDNKPENKENCKSEDINLIMGSMVPVEDILALAEKKEKGVKENINNMSKKEIDKINNKSNSDIENFDLNDFLDPFDLDEENELDVIKSSQNEFEPRSKRVITSSGVRNTATTCSQTNLNKNMNSSVQKSTHSESFGLNVSPSVNQSPGFVKPFFKALDKKSVDISPERSLNTQVITETSPSVFSRSYASSRFKSFSSSHPTITCAKSLYNTSFQNCTTKNETEGPNRTKFNETVDESTIGGRAFRIRNKRAIESSESEDETVISKPISRQRKRKKYNFIESQAAVCGNESSGNDEEEDDIASQYIVDSIVVHDDDIEDHPAVNMEAKYLQSVRSPLKVVGRYRFPSKLKPMNYSDIFSQPIQHEDMTAYKEDSFVVTDDEDAENDICSQSCVLEKAEAILKARRKERKRGIRNDGIGITEKTVPKRRRLVIRMSISSSDET